MTTHPVTALPRTDPRLVARNLDTGEVLADRIAVASCRRDRARGLLGCHALPAGHGLWIAPCRGVHTCGMRFAIDLVALDRSGRIIDAVAYLRPWRVRWPRSGTVGVLELPAGRLADTGTQLGHLITLARVGGAPGPEPSLRERAARKGAPRKGGTMENAA